LRRFAFIEGNTHKHQLDRVGAVDAAPGFVGFLDVLVVFGTFHCIDRHETLKRGVSVSAARLTATPVALPIHIVRRRPLQRRPFHF
jgi:hypothetical protein